MRLETFVKRLQNQKAVNYSYHNDVFEGLISIWKYGDSYVLTWEECVAGNQYNEHSYTKDEKYEFARIEELLDFLDKNAIAIDDFTP